MGRRRRRAERRARGPRALEHLDEGGDRRPLLRGRDLERTVDGVTVSLVEGTVLPSTVADSNTVAGSLIRNPDGKDTDDAAADWAFTTTLTRGAANGLRGRSESPGGRLAPSRLRQPLLVSLQPATATAIAARC